MRNLIAAISLFWRQVRRPARPDTPDHVPDFPLRCQHCNEPIGRSRWNLIDDGVRVMLFRDASGEYSCAPARPHKPMPSVLG